MRFVIDFDGEDFVFQNEWDTVIPVSFTTLYGETVVTLFPSVEEKLRRYFAGLSDADIYSDGALDGLFDTLASDMEEWGYTDDRFRDRWGYIFRGREADKAVPVLENGVTVRLLRPEDEERNETTYDIGETLADGRLAAGVLSPDGRVLSVAVTHAAVDRDTVRVEVGVETLPAARKKGYASAALYALVKLLSARGIETEYRCQRYNTASRHVAERVGLSEVGRYYYYVGRRKYGI